MTTDKTLEQLKAEVDAVWEAYDAAANAAADLGDLAAAFFAADAAYEAALEAQENSND